MLEVLEPPAVNGPDRAVFEFVVQLATRAIADLASNRTIAYTTSSEAGVSPAAAATLLGVSRHFVDRLMADGKLTHRYKPGSKHRIISITEINNRKAEREHGRNGGRRAIDALVDGGVEYWNLRVSSLTPTCCSRPHWQICSPSRWQTSVHA